MSDLYVELLVKKKSSSMDSMKKGLLIGGTVVCIVGGILYHPLLLIGALAFLVMDFLLLPRLDLEYEYLYVNGELDIDKIMSKQKRKKAARYDLKEMEIVAPKNSHELDSYKNNQSIKVRDFSSNEETAKTYGMVVKGEKGLELVYFEPNEAILKDMQRIAPRNVKMY